MKVKNIKEYNKVFGNNWNESEYLLGTTNILSENFILKNAKIVGIDDETIAYIIKVAKKIDDSPALKKLFVHMHYLFFICPDSTENIDENLPEIEKNLNKDGFTYNLLLALSGINISKKYFDSLAMPEDVAEGALKDILLWVQHFKNNLGVIGLTTRILLWERDLFKGKLYRLGRLQFNIRPFSGKIVVFRNKKTNQVQALVDNGIVINSLGQFDGVDGVFDKAGTWTSSLLREELQVTGNPVSQQGNVQHKNLCIRLSQWDEVLSPGDPILDTHIPAGGNFNVQSCAESLTYAIEFFTKYFPDKSFKGLACHSWFLDNQYEMILSEHSNILKFQHELYLYPLSEGGEDSYWRIFGENGMKDGIKNAPRNNSMQRAVAEFIEKGGKLRAGGGFFLKDDMPFGKQVYRNMGL
jgi:GNAT-like C-terminal domain